ncbi:unnamed protein product [Aphanomyces euteiches]
MEIVPLDAASLPAVRRLNMAALPGPVQGNVYKDALVESECSWVALKRGKVVGAVILHSENDKACIRTLAVDAVERGQGIGRMLVEKAIETALGRNQRLYLHVQVDNQEAIELYRRLGFTVAETLTNYYRRLASPDCFVMTRDARS